MLRQLLCQILTNAMFCKLLNWGVKIFWFKHYVWKIFGISFSLREQMVEGDTFIVVWQLGSRKAEDLLLGLGTWHDWSVGRSFHCRVQITAVSHCKGLSFALFCLLEKKLLAWTWAHLEASNPSTLAILLLLPVVRMNFYFVPHKLSLEPLHIKHTCFGRTGLSASLQWNARRTKRAWNRALLFLN